MLTNIDLMQFDNRFVGVLPADNETKNYRRQVEDACFSYVSPTKFPHAKLIAYSAAAQELDLSAKICNTSQFAAVFSGNEMLDQMQPYAMCYGGHQFGTWAGQLGDGRAINLGEVINQNGARWALQLKGAGATPYSRGADGLAVLRSSIREFICSEAMYYLGAPTTRALSLTLTGEEVMRDMLLEPGAIVCRMSPSFVRFGNFQIFAARGDLKTLKKLIDYTITTDFPHLGKPAQNVYLQWFTEITQLTLKMILSWQQFGFVHGVMNTDNMSILGLTIDYGPYGWLDGYDPNWTPNTTDMPGRRYCFANQAQISLWNLVQLANALLPIIKDTKYLQKILDSYAKDYQTGYEKMMAKKLGLVKFERSTDEQLITELTAILQLSETDMTIFFRKLATLDFSIEPLEDITDKQLIEPLLSAYYQPDEVKTHSKRIAAWIRAYIIRLSKDNLPHDKRIMQMNKVNPKYIFRNYIAQLAIEKAEIGDYSMIQELLELFKNPYDEQPQYEQFAAKRPEWARNKKGCSTLSCSS